MAVSREFDAVAVRELIVRDDAKSLFVLRMPSTRRGAISKPEAIEAVLATWNQTWQAAGRETPPSVLIIEAGVHLSSLTGDELREVGHMRIPRQGEERAANDG
jgi:hypothetical protein